MNLERLSGGQKVKLITIGTLTSEQLNALNADHLDRGLNEMIEEVVFLGRHLYKGRILRDRYTIEDVLEQISSAMSHISIMVSSKYMTAMQNQNPRADRYGNKVRDKAVFECSVRHPRPELFSVMPKGDKIKPVK
jgi:hypothetical protein